MVVNELDVEEIKQLVESIEADNERVLLMPEGIDKRTLDARKQWLEDVCEQFGYRFCPRMHIEWYGNKRGK